MHLDFFNNICHFNYFQVYNLVALCTSEHSEIDTSFSLLHFLYLQSTQSISLFLQPLAAYPYFYPVSSRAPGCSLQREES